MNFNLLSQNLLLGLCSIFTGLSVFIIVRVFKIEKVIKNNRKTKNAAPLQNYELRNLKLAGTGLAASFLAALLILRLFSYLTDSILPISLLFMIVPFTISIALLVITIWFKKPMKTVASVGAFIGLIFSLVLINNYYRFYPTLGEVFNINSNVQNIGEGQTGVVVNVAHLGTNNYANSIENEINTVSQESTAGKVYSLEIPGAVSKFKARAAYVYEPAIYNKITNLNLPVIVLLAGVPGAPENWLGAGMQATLDQFAGSHDGITPLVFIVDDTGGIGNDTECVNSPLGNVETYLTVDVPAYIKSHFRVVDNPSDWAIGGLSMGGMCSIMLTLRHPNVYHYFMDYGGEIGPEDGSKQRTLAILFGGSENNWAAHQPNLLLASKNYKNSGIGGFFGDGQQDSRSVAQAVSQLASESQRAGLQTVSEIINGQHTFEVWSQLFKDSLPWVSSRIGATQCAAVCI